MKTSIGRMIALAFVLILLVALVGFLASVGTYRQNTDSLLADIELQAELLKRTVLYQETVSRANMNYYRYLLTADSNYLDHQDELLSGAAEAMGEMQAQSPTDDLKAHWRQLADLFRTWQSEWQAVVVEQKAGHRDEALRRYQASVIPIRSEQFQVMSRLTKAQDDYFSQHRAAAVRRSDESVGVMLLLMGVVLLIGVAVSWRVTRTITSRLRAAISTLLSASAEVLAATSQQAAGGMEQLRSVKETATTIEEFRQTVHVSAQKARAVADAVVRNTQVAQDGRKAVEESVRLVKETRERMEVLAERVITLSEQGAEIGDMNTTVKELSEQTNLLAVNAAIEAAKAGETGKGFAVVAGEMRSLAGQSKQATTQVRTILLEVQQATQAAVLAAEQGVKALDSADGASARAGEAIAVLADSVADSAQAAQQILISAQQQVVGADQMGQAMVSIETASSQNLASVKQLERAAHEMNRLAMQLGAMIGEGSDQLESKTAP